MSKIYALAQTFEENFEELLIILYYVTGQCLKSWNKQQLACANDKLPNFSPS
jgi:hypothetical protein